MPDKRADFWRILGIVVPMALLVGHLFNFGQSQPYTLWITRHFSGNSVVKDCPACDHQALQRLIKRISRQGDPYDSNAPRPLVKLEEFFEGNQDYGSIGYNFYPYQPSPQEFYNFFRSIRDKPEVYDVLVELRPLEEADKWPYSDMIWIITSADVDEVNRWLGEQYQADAPLYVGFEDLDEKMEDYEVPEGMQALGVWWD